jgi:hypothetical protein
MDGMTILSAVRPRRLPHLGWGVLLVPAMALSLTLWGVHYSTLVIVLLAAVIWYITPALAADLVPIALINLGVQWIIGAVTLVRGGDVAVPSGIGGLLINYKSISAESKNPGRGSHILIIGITSRPSPDLNTPALEN